MVNALGFEIGVLFVYGFLLFRMTRLSKILKALRNDYGQIVMIKNYEAQLLNGDISVEEKDFNVRNKSKKMLEEEMLYK